jgi:hypothetical protein
MAAEIPAGWYPNPWNDAEELYWSGTEWTGISRAVHQAAASAGGAAAAPEIEESTVMRPVGPGAGAQFDAQAGGAQYGSPQPGSAQFAAPQPGGASFGVVYGAGAGPQDAPAYAPQQSAPPLPAAVPGPPTTPPAVPPTPAAAPHSTAPYPDAGVPAPPAAAPTYSYDGSASAPYVGTASTPYAGTASYAAPAQNGASFAPPPQPYDAATFPSDSADAATIRWALGSSPTAPATNRRAKFGLVAMILGIVAAVFAVIPGLSFAAWVPAFVAIALGIIGYLGGKPRAFALAGIIAGGAALAVGTGVSIWFLIQLGQFGH